MTQPYTLSIAAAAEQIRTGQLSPVDLVRSCLDRIGQLELQLKAWVTVDANAALSAAQECETAIRQGHYRGPLHGIPVGIKDIFFTAGVKTTMGSPIYADFVPDYDATSVTRLKEAGAVIIGKAQTTSLQSSTPHRRIIRGIESIHRVAQAVDRQPRLPRLCVPEPSAHKHTAPRFDRPPIVAV